MPKKTDIAKAKRDGNKPPENSSSKFARLLEGATKSASGMYSLRLYITGSTPRSTRAVTSIRKLCEEHLHGRYQLEVIDIYQQPEHAVLAQIIAAPTLIKTLPLPLRRFIGNLSDSKKMLVALDINDSQKKAA
ncbi:MAG TPA: circadian clock KaiB family protein [Pseudomonadales bacterium]|nr:circadian clock KaiB family protein [Pseudomonadales bacterium]